jgi:predicted amino acid-binding ACT domain protein
VNCDDQQAIVCLVGEDIHGVPGIAASVFSTIAKAGVNIRMISQGASELNISFVIQESDVPQAVRHLHARFFGAATPTQASPARNRKPRRGNGLLGYSGAQDPSSMPKGVTRLNPAKRSKSTDSIGQDRSARAAANSRGY